MKVIGMGKNLSAQGWAHITSERAAGSGHGTDSNSPAYRARDLDGASLEGPCASFPGLCFWWLRLQAPGYCQGSAAEAELGPGSGRGLALVPAQGGQPWAWAKRGLQSPGKAGCQLRDRRAQGHSEAWVGQS